MKDVTQAYIDKEEADQRKPVEIYKIWRMDESEFWYYTSGDVSITFDGQDYIPVPIKKRSQVSYDAILEITRLSIDIEYVTDPFVDFLSVNPIEIIWISVMKLHRDQSPLEADVVFIGQIKDVSFKGVQASVSCVGFQHFLKKTVPQWRNQVTCNHQVFDSRCGLDPELYKATGTVTLDSSKTILTGTLFGTQADGYWVGGEVKFDVESRTVVAHVGNQVTLMYRMIELDNGESVDVFPGCDQRAETCRDRYDNILQFLGMKDTPIENPSTRVTW